MDLLEETEKHKEDEGEEERMKERMQFVSRMSSLNSLLMQFLRFEIFSTIRI